MATTLGCLPSAIDDESISGILELLDYWTEEPPTHVILAMRYLGESRGRKKQPSEEEARRDMGALAGMLGQQPRKLPPELKQMIRNAEQLKHQHKGL